jgi:hypothetical protein
MMMSKREVVMIARRTMVARVMDVRKLPIQVEALLWNGENFGEVEGFTDGKAVDGELGPNGRLFIETLEGRMEAKAGSWIIKGVHGEFYACEPNIFAETYEILGPREKAVGPLTGTMDFMGAGVKWENGAWSIDKGSMEPKVGRRMRGDAHEVHGCGNDECRTSQPHSMLPSGDAIIGRRGRFSPKRGV